MGFILGLLMGLLGAMGLVGFLAYSLCSRSNHIAVARFINGIAQALACTNKVKAADTLGTGKDGEAMEQAGGTRKGKARERWTIEDNQDGERP